MPPCTLDTRARGLRAQPPIISGRVHACIGWADLASNPLTGGRRAGNLSERQLSTGHTHSRASPHDAGGQPAAPAWMRQQRAVARAQTAQRWTATRSIASATARDACMSRRRGAPFVHSTPCPAWVARWLVAAVHTRMHSTQQAAEACR